MLALLALRLVLTSRLNRAPLLFIAARPVQFLIDPEATQIMPHPTTEYSYGRNSHDRIPMRSQFTRPNTHTVAHHATELTRFIITCKYKAKNPVLLTRRDFRLYSYEFRKFMRI